MADGVGLIGQRLSWASKALWAIIVAMSSPLDSRFRNNYLTIASTMAPRASSFRRELTDHALDATFDHLGILIDALKLIGKAGMRVRGVPPLLHRLRVADYPMKLEEFQRHYNAVSAALMRASELRHKKKIRTVRLWARGATDKMAHRATKRPDVSATKSASSDKSHRGELSDQKAADHGMIEWGGTWLADDCDAGDDLLQQVEDIYMASDDSDLPVITLPPLTGTSLRKGSLRFRSDTAVGVDSVRPRHFARLSTAALNALARLLTLFERHRRWASIAREVIEVARGKKSGGARLVGLGASLYRLWARTRFEDIRGIMEPRVERAFLPAAPGRGLRYGIGNRSRASPRARCGHDML